jgi:hypothetical protein
VENMLTQETLKEILVYDSNTGIFTRKNDSSNKRWKAGSIVGTIQYSDKHKSYKRMLIRISKMRFYGHQLAFLYVHGYIPSEISHDNQNSLDNRICNLSDSSHSDNMKNLKMNKLNTSGVSGITISKDRSKKFRVSIGSCREIKSF